MTGVKASNERSVDAVEKLKLLTIKSAVPMFEIVRGWEESHPTYKDPKSYSFGSILIIGAIPVPLSSMVAVGVSGSSESIYAYPRVTSAVCGSNVIANCAWVFGAIKGEAAFKSGKLITSGFTTISGKPSSSKSLKASTSLISYSWHANVSSVIPKNNNDRVMRILYTTKILT